jgi:D-alanyl-lipoteichoic acid acyltransferase DltB (MBOAT superfamily)
MDITSLDFVLASVLTIFLFYLLSQKLRIILLIMLSCAFIASYSYYLLLYVLIYALINYIIALKIPSTKHKKALFRVGIIINLSQLIVLKYSSFAIDPIINIFHSNLHIAKIAEIIVPMGISYFTLQGIGYLINIKMTWEMPERNFMHFLLYLTFYPKFLSGPVERSNHFLPQIKVNRSFDQQQVTGGLKIALFGFFKKLVIANQLAPYVFNAYADINSANGYLLWLLFFFVPLYLYFDFSGYTDIAIGFAKTFGIELLPNFNNPFFSESVTSFWKRFHISLSSWFNDYVFRLVSFKRRKWGIYASIYALFLTWIMFGIWHGAGWNFMALGLLQALAITYEFFTKKLRIKLLSKVPNYYRIWIGRIFTYLFYCISLIFFFSPDIKSSIIYFSKLKEVNGPLNLDPLVSYPFLVIIYISVFLLLELIQNDFINTSKKLRVYWISNSKKYTLARWFLYSIVITLILVVGNKAEHFIYVNF